jgi:hypothetical protein
VRRSWHCTHLPRSTRRPSSSPRVDASLSTSASAGKPARGSSIFRRARFSCDNTEPKACWLRYRFLEHERNGEADEKRGADEHGHAEKGHERRFEMLEIADDSDFHEQDDADGEAQREMHDGARRKLDLVVPDPRQHLRHEQGIDHQERIAVRRWRRIRSCACLRRGDRHVPDLLHVVAVAIAGLSVAHIVIERLAGIGELLRSTLPRDFAEVRAASITGASGRPHGEGASRTQVQRLVAHDVDHPRHRREAVRVVFGGVPLDFHERVLQDLLRPVAILQSQRDAVESRGSGAIEIDEGHAVAQRNGRAGVEAFRWGCRSVCRPSGRGDSVVRGPFILAGKIKAARERL